MSDDLQKRVTAIGLTHENRTGMAYRHVGRSGLIASAIGVGCFPFGGFASVPDSCRVVDQALDLGINYFDTANSYGIGKSESALGVALEGKRDRALIATKFGNRTGDGPNDIGASRMAIVRACEASLNRLKTDYIDLYQLHWPDHETPIEETLRALDDLVRAGKVRYVGCSNLFAWEIAEAHFTAEKLGVGKFISAQDHYNLLYRDIEKRFEPFCVKYGVGMTHYFPLAGGMLSGAYQRGAITPGTRQANNPNTAAWQSERNWDVQEKLLAFARERGWTLPQMSIAWLLQRPATFTVIAGADRPEHLQENVKALQVRFTPEDLVEIDRITLVDEDRSVAPPYRTLRPEKVHEFEPMQRARAGAPSKAAH
ncbi:aldo/keto reductase [Ramlibacter sp.]|uniref:aldo/keto reductase n=1 Tax=Ramlibacter sp. TaxID=1917967 RepID=UPI002619ABF7|nr:aldo/keto reductase [Ramlibacter sp.]MDB5955503.1 Aryl-alcohol dehydrogenase-like predicted oxidoreductase [Ramlibacter sp.]